MLICNSEAGRQRWRRPHQIQAVERELESNGKGVVTYHTTRAGEGATVARNAVDGGAELIVVCGGDGTINDVVCGMAHSEVPLAVLPGGTANMLARELGLPLDIVAAARLISKSVPRRLALGSIGQRYFVLMVGVGFDAHVVRNVNGHWKKLFGMAIYVMEAIRQLVLDPPRAFILSAEQRRHEVTFACISRAQFYGPVRMVREANLLSDQFYVYGFCSKNPFRYFRYLLAIMTAQHTRLPDFCGFPAQKVHCEQIATNANRISLQVDGEFAGELPCTIEIVPDALTLLMPLASSGNK